MIRQLLKPEDALRRIGWAILALSFGLRALLAYRGGQLFWPDEDRFEIARQTAKVLLDGSWREAADLLLSRPDHLLFKLVALVPATLETVAGTPGWVSALFFAAASTWVLWLVARVSRAAGGSQTESIVALVLAACTTSLFYYSRHFFPYDLSLGLFLLCLLAGLRETNSRGNSILAGVWAGLGYLAYNGYWTMGACLLAIHVLLALPHPGAMARRFTYALLGLVIPIVAVAAISGAFGHDFFALTFAFAGTANQGELDQAPEFALRYFWSAEHGLAVLWVVALLMSLDRTGRPAGVRAFLWPGLTLLLAALLILPPGFLHHFAITARHLRALAPLFCLTAAGVLANHPGLRQRPRLLVGLLALVALQAGFNFATPLSQVFPREFERMAVAHLAEARKSDLGPYKIVNASFLHNPNWAPAGPDAGVVRLRRNHPFQFTPYLYEGYSAVIRDRYLERDLSMRVVRLDAGGPPLHGYPEGMLELILQFPLKPESLLPEPLLSTGASGRGDTLFIRYDGPDHFVLGHDHIGGGAVVTPRLELDRRRPHRLLIGMDSFSPPNSLTRSPRRFVLWNNVLLLHDRAELHPSTPDQIAIGHNFIGASTAINQLSAEIIGFRRIPFPKLGAAFPSPPGVLHLELLRSPAFSAGQAEPLLSSGSAGMGDLLFLRHEGDGRLRIGLDHWGSGALLSEPFSHDSSRRLELIVAMGPFLPPADQGADDTRQARRLYVSCNGQVILNRLIAFHPSAPDELILGENHAASTAVAPRLVSELLLCEPASADIPAADPTGHPGPVRLTLRFPTTTRPDQSLPLLSTGQNGAGDLLFIRFDGHGHYQIGHDHWGHSMVLSTPRPFNPARPLELTVSLGSLFPKETATDGPGAPWRHHLFVAAGADVLLNQPARFHSAKPGAWVVGFNHIGSSSAAELLPADLLNISPVSPESIRPLLKLP